MTGTEYVDLEEESLSCEDVTEFENLSPRYKESSEKCYYGEECYRMNVEHLKKYHPEKLNENSCPFGEKCYRKNVEHIKKWHPEKLKKSMY